MHHSRSSRSSSGAFPTPRVTLASSPLSMPAQSTNSARPLGRNGRPHRQPMVTALPELDRRNDSRKPMPGKATLTVLDGPTPNSVHQIQTRDLTPTGVSFLSREPISVGLICRLDITTPGKPATHACEIIRSRPLSNGRYEMAVQFRKSM